MEEERSLLGQVGDILLTQFKVAAKARVDAATPSVRPRPLLSGAWPLQCWRLCDHRLQQTSGLPCCCAQANMNCSLISAAHACETS